MSVKVLKVLVHRVDLLKLINNCQLWIHEWMRFGCVEPFNSINVVPCGQGKATFLQQEPRTWKAERENFGPLPLKCQWIRQTTSLSQEIL